mgnify:CR=1 FL=1
MAQKQHGTTKNVTPNTKAIKASSAKYIKALESGLYDKELSFFDKNTGGYLCILKTERWIIWSIMLQPLWLSRGNR